MYKEYMGTYKGWKQTFKASEWILKGLLGKINH